MRPRGPDTVRLGMTRMELIGLATMLRARKFTLWLFVGLLAAVAGLPPSAQAQDAELIGRFGDWDAYTRGTAGNRFCYMVSKPKEASLRSRRGEIFFLVWHRPDQKEFDVVQVDIGYPFKPGSRLRCGSAATPGTCSPATKAPGPTSLPMTRRWCAALRKGSRMSVKGTSSRNNPTTDSYSLKGTSAYSAIGKACGRG